MDEFIKVANPKSVEFMISWIGHGGYFILMWGILQCFLAETEEF